MSLELCGFAEDENAVDGDWEAFNYCLAENYYDAMLGEEWDVLGHVWFKLIENIIFWLSYNSGICQGYDVQAIGNGTFMTIRGRTFLDAIITERKIDWAKAYISLNVLDVRLYILCMFHMDDESIEQFYNGTIMNRINRLHVKKEKKIEFLSLIFNELEKIYQGLNDNQEKKQFLSIVRKNVDAFRWYTYGDDVSLKDYCSEGFARKLINKENRYE